MAAHYVETNRKKPRNFDALDNQGIKVSDFRNVSCNKDGFIFTELRIKRTWELSSGNETCKKPCESPDEPHIPQESLTEQQKETLTVRMADFVYASICNFDILLSLHNTDFKGIALSQHED